MFRIFLSIIFLLIIANAFITNYQTNLKRKEINILKMNNNALLNNDHLPLFSKFDNNQVVDDINKILFELNRDFSKLERSIQSEEDVHKLYNLAIEEMERIANKSHVRWFKLLN